MTHRKMNIEECPLKNHNQCRKRESTFKGPARVIRLCLLGIITPTLLIAIPLYMRYRVYSDQLYPLAMSDMRLLDNKISTTWCQRQKVQVNTTFNAFLLAKPPELSQERKPLTMVRHLILEDDTKEYWGFYLLKGSSVTVSTCVRWPGASLIVIRGHKHLHECAYIGDNSSEELDELMEAIREGTYVKPETAEEDNAPVNEPDFMKRHREDVQFHDPLHLNTSKIHTVNDVLENYDISDPKTMKKILDALEEKTGRKGKSNKQVQKDDDEDDENHVHVHRNSTIAKDETNNVKIINPSESEFDLNKLSSHEIYTHIVKKLESMGERGTSVLNKLSNKDNQNNNKPGVKVDPKMIDVNNNIQEHINMRGRVYHKPPVNFDDNIDKARRRKRDLIIQTAMSSKFNEHDEENDLAIEEGFVPDGIADHRGIFNETTLNDKSNSEFWSSFSSSEEALLNCAGLILNLPLTPHHKCNQHLSESEAEETNLANTITYKVPVNGYYFFVFNSENEIQPNYIRVQFHLNKAVYNVSNPISSCSNTSSSCSLDLRFFSNQKLVMELPVRENDTLWNEEFVVISECEPRTVIYAICVIAVPVMVVLFAFS